MIEKIVYDYLAGTMTVPIFMEVPPDPPESFIVIQKTGSFVENFIRSGTLAVQSYAGSKYEAAVLNEAVITAMGDIVELASVFGCDLNSDYDYTDPDTKRYRYQAVFDVVY